MIPAILMQVPSPLSPYNVLVNLLYSNSSSNSRESSVLTHYLLCFMHSSSHFYKSQRIYGKGVPFWRCKRVRQSDHVFIKFVHTHRREGETERERERGRDLSFIEYLLSARHCGRPIDIFSVILSSSWSYEVCSISILHMKKFRHGDVSELPK